MQIPKPKGLEPQYGAQFQDASVVGAYGHRASYPDETFAILADLLLDTPRNVLDVGCGRGEIARRLLPYAEHVDAVDISPGMIAEGVCLPGGNDPRLHWIVAAVEDAALDPPYVLITAGSSLHWMDWYRVLPRFAALLTSNGVLAIVGNEGPRPAWAEERLRIINRYSTNRDYQPYNLIEELERRDLFVKMGERTTAVVPFAQRVDDYIEAQHSMNGLSRDRMVPEAAHSFDHEMRALLFPYSSDGILHLESGARVVWGKPQSPRSLDHS